MTSSLQIIGSRRSGGAERFFARLMNSLNRHGVKATAVTPPSSEIRDDLEARVPWRALPMRGIWDLMARYRIARLAREECPAVVQTWMGRATRLTHLPPRLHSVHVARLGGYYDVNRYRHVDAWVGNTRGICDYLVRAGLPAASVYHIGNFVAPASSSPACERACFGIEADDLVVLGLGRLHPNKGFADLLEAFAKVPARIDDRRVVAVVVGDGPLRDDLRQLSRDLRIESRVRWTGWQRDPGKLYALADVFVCASRHEPLGNVILEAWSHRLPVVSTATEGPLEILTNGEDGLLVPREAPGALTAVLIDLLRASPGERHRLGDNGKATLERRHSEAAITQAYLDLYQRLTS